MNVKLIKEEIERLIDHYTAYRPILDSELMIGSRNALHKLNDFIIRENK